VANVILTGYHDFLFISLSTTTFTFFLHNLFQSSLQLFITSTGQWDSVTTLVLWRTEESTALTGTGWWQRRQECQTDERCLSACTDCTLLSLPALCSGGTTFTTQLTSVICHMSSTTHTHRFKCYFQPPSAVGLASRPSVISSGAKVLHGRMSFQTLTRGIGHWTSQFLHPLVHSLKHQSVDAVWLCQQYVTPFALALWHARFNGRFQRQYTTSNISPS